MASLSLGEVGFNTKDVRALSEFYAKLFELPLAEELNDVHQTLLIPGGVLTFHNDGTPKNDCNQNMCVAFTAEDVDIVYEELKRLGVRIVQEPKLQPWGAKNLCFLDPDGNSIYLRSFPK